MTLQVMKQFPDILPSKKRPRSMVESMDSTSCLNVPEMLQPSIETNQTNCLPKEVNNASDSLRRSLMGLSLQLKLKMMLMEAWACDMNSVIMERNLLMIAKELASLERLGVYEELTCIRFLDLARNRMIQLLSEAESRETLKMEAKQMWTIAQIQTAQDNTTMENSDPFPMKSTGPNRDILVLWKAMEIAKDRGAHLWNENKPEEALPFLLAADSYMKRFTLKYQRLKIDQAMVDTSEVQLKQLSPKRKLNRVSFVDEPVVMGIADSEVDRRPINPSRPSKLESLLLRTSREFPVPNMELKKDW